MMKTRSTTALAGAALLCSLSFFSPACAEPLDARCAAGACDPRDGSPTADGGDDASDAPTDPCLENPTSAECLDESKALFVSASTGDDKDPLAGSRNRPFKTIGTAITKIDAFKRRVYVCDGTYAESVTIIASLSILGGLACDWVGKGKNPRIAPAKGVALTILRSSTVALTDIDIDGAADTQVSGDSAIAVFVSESKGVLFRRVAMRAGPATDGAPGADGTSASNYAGAIAASGLSTGTSAAAASPICGTCSDGSLSTGGRGAASAGVAAMGTAVPAVGGDNSGGTLGGVCSPGGGGAAGVAAAAAAGADRPGTLTGAGWLLASTAKKGVNGTPGQGGGGGGSTATVGGGSGGCGGCGGAGGGPGTNGGSSFALLAFESDVSVESSTLTASKGGIGGRGGKGEDGQLRGGPGSGACLGGAGGQGAGGGGGGGGAGGHSASIAHTGKPLTTTDTTMKPAAAGAQGAGGTAGAGPGTPGAEGKPGAIASAVEVLEL